MWCVCECRVSAQRWKWTRQGRVPLLTRPQIHPLRVFRLERIETSFLTEIPMESKLTQARSLPCDLFWKRAPALDHLLSSYVVLTRKWGLLKGYLLTQDITHMREYVVEWSGASFQLSSLPFLFFNGVRISKKNRLTSSKGIKATPFSFSFMRCRLTHDHDLAYHYTTSPSHAHVHTMHL